MPAAAGRGARPTAVTADGTADVPRSQAAGPPRLVGPIRGLFDVYVTEMRIAIAEQFQYRVANYFYMIGMVAEPVIYLVVWSTDRAASRAARSAASRPGAVRRLLHRLDAGPQHEHRLHAVRLGGAHPRGPALRRCCSGRSSRSVEDLGFFAGWKFVVIIMWLPIAAVLVLLFHPTLNPSPLDIAVFAVAIWGAYLIRSLNQSSLGLITFWTTRVGPIFQLYIAAELLLSGRLVPLTLMPDWAQRLADVLPFKWTFGFPIEALVGQPAGGPADRRPGDAALLDRRRLDPRPRRLALRRPPLQRRGRLMAAPDRRPLRLLWALLPRRGALNELQYRANFAVQLFQSAIALGTGLAVLALVFSQTTELNGWTQPELLAVMGVHILMGGVIGTSSSRTWSG